MPTSIRLLLAAALVPALTASACHPTAPPTAPPTDPPRGAEDAAVIRVPGLALPESALWDERADVYLVSNIGGAPFAEDDDGFIARVSPSGALLDRLVDGADADVRLDSPRGLALDGDTLYVADLRTVRLFDRATGAPRGSWPIDGAVMLNDLVVADGALYASDSGLPPDRQPAGARHAIYRFALDGASRSATAVLSAPDLGRPNGLAVRDGSLWVATYGSGELFRVCGDTSCDRERLPAGGLDGLVITAAGTFLIASWEGAAVYSGRPGGPWTVAISDVASAADLGWDARRRRVLVPLLEPGVLAIHPLR